MDSFCSVRNCHHHYSEAPRHAKSWYNMDFSENHSLLPEKIKFNVQIHILYVSRFKACTLLKTLATALTKLEIYFYKTYKLFLLISDRQKSEKRKCGWGSSFVIMLQTFWWICLVTNTYLNFKTILCIHGCINATM